MKKTIAISLLITISTCAMDDYGSSYLKKLLTQKKKRLEEAKEKMSAMEHTEKPKDKIKKQEKTTKKRQKAVNALKSMVREKEHFEQLDKECNENRKKISDDKRRKDICFDLVMGSLLVSLIWAGSTDLINKYYA